MIGRLLQGTALMAVNTTRYKEHTKSPKIYIHPLFLADCKWEQEKIKKNLQLKILKLGHKEFGGTLNVLLEQLLLFRLELWG
jgi:hypothetical protein